MKWGISVRLIVVCVPVYSHIRFVWLDVMKVYSKNFVKPGLSDTGCAQPVISKQNPIAKFEMNFMLVLIKRPSKIL